MAGNVKLLTSAGGGVILDTATTTATDVTVKVPVTGVNNGTLVCSDSSGNVGIGTSSPGEKLSVAGRVVVNGSGYTTSPVGLVLGQYSSSKVYIQKPAGYALSFWDNATNDLMMLDSSGYVIVGGTSNFAASKFTVVGTTDGIGVNITGTYLLNFGRSGSLVGTVTTNGTSTAYNTSSDYRLKENIAPMTGALSVVQQLNPVTYTWKADGSAGQGFIAHELQAVVPDCVTGEKDAVDEEGNPVYQGIDTSFLVATLTKAIQELSAKNDALEARIATLEAK